VRCLSAGVPSLLAAARRARAERTYALRPTLEPLPSALESRRSTLALLRYAHTLYFGCLRKSKGLLYTLYFGCLKKSKGLLYTLYFGCLKKSKGWADLHSTLHTSALYTYTLYTSVLWIRVQQSKQQSNRAGGCLQAEPLYDIKYKV